MTKEPSYGREQYFDASPSIPSDPASTHLRLRDVHLELETDTGVFSYKGLDDGTRVLLQVAPDPPVRGDLLDLGCGYGPVAVTLAHRYRERVVWATDVNERAVDLTNRNATRLRLSNVRVALARDMPPQLTFAAIYSNPPIRIGKVPLQRLLVSWLSRLVPGGCAWLVVKKNLGADSLAEWLTEQGFPTERHRSKRGYRVLRADCPR